MGSLLSTGADIASSLLKAGKAVEDEDADGVGKGIGSTLMNGAKQLASNPAVQGAVGDLASSAAGALGDAASSAYNTVSGWFSAGKVVQHPETGKVAIERYVEDAGKIDWGSMLSTGADIAGQLISF